MPLFRRAARRSGSCPSAHRPAPASTGATLPPGTKYPQPTQRPTMTKAPPPPEERSCRASPREARCGGLLARGHRQRRLPAPTRVGTVANAAGSPLTVAGAAPVSHRTSLSHRMDTLSRRRADCQRARLTRRAVHRNDPPAMPHAGAVDMVDASDRAVFHREGEAGFGFEPEREAERGADRAAMRDRDDVTAAIGVEH